MVSLGDPEGIIRRNEVIPRETLKVGDRALLYYGCNVKIYPVFFKNTSISCSSLFLKFGIYDGVIG